MTADILRGVMPKPPSAYVQAIRNNGLTIYDPIEVGDPQFWIPTPELETLISNGLCGFPVPYPQRTRSKVVKTRVCQVLGYPVPVSFKKTKPRFPGQCFDTYVQNSDNLQIWNEEIAPTRRYVIFGVSNKDIITGVKVMTGEEVALLDRTGTLTKKYQAQIIPGPETAVLLTEHDTDNLRDALGQGNAFVQTLLQSPIEHPTTEFLLPITEIFNRLRNLVGVQFADTGHDQRNRGAGIHRLVCQRLGYSDYRDDGRLPDVRNQLLEIKLQTSPTIDLGLVRPNSTEPLDTPKLNGRRIRHCDVRYAVFYATTDGSLVSITHLYLTTGESFFTHFRQFQGKVVNAKLQIPLPRGFFG